MQRVLGIGGYFIKAADPAALSAWYRECLGVDADENGLWRQEAGLTAEELPHGLQVACGVQGALPCRVSRLVHLLAARSGLGSRRQKLERSLVIN